MEKKIIITAENGLHARPAAALAKLATSFKSDIRINGANAKSIMNLMSCGVKKGDELTITTSGEDEVAAMDAITELIINLK